MENVIEEKSFQKETVETKYWLRLLEVADILTEKEFCSWHTSYVP